MFKPGRSNVKTIPGAFRTIKQGKMVADHVFKPDLKPVSRIFRVFVSAFSAFSVFSAQKARNSLEQMKSSRALLSPENHWESSEKRTKMQDHKSSEIVFQLQPTLRDSSHHHRPPPPRESISSRFRSFSSRSCVDFESRLDNDSKSIRKRSKNDSKSTPWEGGSVVVG